jgi:hypothetical protein
MSIFETLNHVKRIVKLHKEEGISATVTTDVTMNGKDARFWIDTEDNISFEIGNGIKQVYGVEVYSTGGVMLVGWDERLKRESKIVVLEREIECTQRIRIEQHQA